MDLINNIYFFSLDIYKILGIILSVIVIHKSFYYAIGFLWTRKFKPAKNKHKYAILIAARNEETVIGNLIDSINKQDYPKELLTVFVVADNCTDKTKEKAIEKGAICYERFDDAHRTKGFALEYLLDRIEEDYGRSSFEGYFIFDADNLLNTNYITKMNDAFDEGCKIITSYRNTKNFDENWIASTYALHWLRSIRANHRARSVLRLATNIQGTGFLFASEIVKNGWHYTSLTEDRALTADVVAQGYQITYQDEAMFYDEQPISLKVALRQRLRWSKGHLMAFSESGPKLFLNIFFGKLFIEDNPNKRGKATNAKEFFLNLVESIRHRFASFDTLVQLTPIVLINLIRWLIVYVIIFSIYSGYNGLENFPLFSGSNYLSKAFAFIFNDKLFNVNPGFFAFIVSLFVTILSRIIYRLSRYLLNCWTAIYVMIVEKDRIKKMKFKDKILFTLTWPTFDIIGRWTIYFAIFMKVTWKPIPHNSKVTIDDIKGASA